MVKIRIIDGSLVEQDVKSIMTLANPSGVWQGAIDKAIRAAFGTQFHDSLELIWKKGMFSTSGSTAHISFGGISIMFVCDFLDTLRPLSTVILPAVEQLIQGGNTPIAIPVFRTGPAFTHYPNHTDEAAERELIETLKRVKGEGEIRIVVYNNPQQSARLRALLTEE